MFQIIFRIISTGNRFFLQTHISLQTWCSIALADKDPQAARVELRDLVQWPRTRPPWGDLGAPHKQGCSPYPHGSDVLAPKPWCHCMTRCWCSYVGHGRGVLIWPPTTPGRRGLGLLRAPIYSPLSSFALGAPSIAPQLWQKAKTSRVHCFSSLCAELQRVQLHVPFLVTSEYFKMSKPHFLLCIPAGITWRNNNLAI